MVIWATHKVRLLLAPRCVAWHLLFSRLLATPTPVEHHQITSLWKQGDYLTTLGAKDPSTCVRCKRMIRMQVACAVAAGSSAVETEPQHSRHTYANCLRKGNGSHVSVWLLAHHQTSCLGLQAVCDVPKNAQHACGSRSARQEHHCLRSTPEHT